MRGEKLFGEIHGILHIGSPPHARGKDVRRWAETTRARITPACAGKRAPCSAFRRCSNGSPPHARGKVVFSRGKDRSARITPACAGKSLFPLPFALRHWDHPRMRGEKWFGCVYADSLGGSPPHARGKEWSVIGDGAACRITPACAGKRRVFPTKPSPTPGSPPHARGKENFVVNPFQPRGITPACAGKRLRKPRKINVPAVPHFGFHLVSQTRKRS